MRLIAKLVGSIFGLLLLIVLLQGVASETGEVVVLTSVDQATSAPTTTRLWVVDHDGAMWLRGDAGMDSACARAIHASGLGTRWCPL
jgi:hypothetical protein